MKYLWSWSEKPRITKNTQPTNLLELELLPELPLLKLKLLELEIFRLTELLKLELLEPEEI